MTEVWGRCPPCDRWFAVPDPRLDAYFLCPACLTPADRWEESSDRREGAGEPA